MRDRELELLFGRIGSEVRPDAEFEEDLLLRLEGCLVDDNLDVSDTANAPVIEFDPIAGRKQRGRRAGRGLAAAAAAVVLIGIAGLTIAVRDRAEDGPVTTTPPPAPATTTMTTTPPPLDSGIAALCARHVDELLRIDDLGSPLSNTAIAPEDDVRAQLVDELVVIVDDYDTILTADESTAQAILDELAAIEADLANEVVFVTQGRLDGVRYSIPTIVDRLLDINTRLAERGASCR